MKLIFNTDSLLMAARQAGNSTSFEESVNILLKVLDDIEKRNAHLHKLCCERKKLFKPWPRRTDGGAEITESAPVQDQHGGTLSSAEKTEIAMMDKMLHRAQKARDVQQKLKESGRPKQTSKDKKEDLVVTTDVHNSGQSGATIGSSERNKTLKEKHPQNSVQGVNQKSVTSVPKSSVTQMSQRDRPPGRASSGVNVRGGKKVMPAHMNAPFQTNPRLSVPKRRVDKRISSGAKCKSAVPQQTVNRKLVENNKHTGGKEDEVITKLKTPDGNMCDDHEIQTQKDSCIGKADSKQTCGPTDTVEDPSSMTTKDSETTSSVVGHFGTLTVEDEPEQKEKRFCLQTDGKNVNISGKLRRLYTNNCRLREKVNLQRMTKKVDACTSRQEFVSKIESTFEWSEAPSVGRKVSAITNMYSNARKILRGLFLEDVTDAWPSGDVLRARSLVEFILTIFYQTEEERLKFNPDILNTITCAGRQPKPMVGPPISMPTSQFWSSSLIDLDLGLYDTLTRPHDCLQYSRQRDADRYTALVFQLQYQQLQLRLLDTIATEVLPWLSHHHYKPRDTVWLFRSLYSILTLDQAFPVVVKDTIQEIEESPENT